MCDDPMFGFAVFESTGRNFGSYLTNECSECCCLEICLLAFFALSFRLRCIANLQLFFQPEFRPYSLSLLLLWDFADLLRVRAQSWKSNVKPVLPLQKVVSTVPIHIQGFSQRPARSN